MTSDVDLQCAYAHQLLKLGHVEEAHPLLKRLSKQQPKNIQVMILLALAERQLKHWVEAIDLLKRAAKLAPGNLQITDHLATTFMLSNRGRDMFQAIEHYATVLAHHPEHEAVAINLSLLALRCDWPTVIIQSIAPLLIQPNLKPALQLHYAASCALAAYLLGDMEACTHYVGVAVSAYGAADEKPDPYYLLRYAEFLHVLIDYRATHPTLYVSDTPLPALHMIGESHCLTVAHSCVHTTYRVVPHLIMGAKAYFFTYEGDTTWKGALQHIIQQIPKDAPLAIGFGELDCRPGEGIMQQYRQDAAYAMEQEIKTICATYVKLIKINQLRRLGKTYIIGVPAPNPVVQKFLQSGEERVFTEMIRLFNAALASEADTQQLGFIDLYAHTVGDDGWAREGMHIDDVHLTPEVANAALRIG